MVPWWVWILIVLLILILIWIWEHVLVPTLTVNTDKGSYDRTETVHITGDVKQGASPLSGKVVKLAIQPPTGDAYSLPDQTTDAQGQYAIDWSVPDDAVAGTYTLTATCLGVSASKTFRQIQMRVAARM